MEIKAIKTYENGFMKQTFAFGGEGMDGLDESVKYRSSIQNYLIDTGDEVIIVDTDMPSEAPVMEVDENTPLSMGERISDYLTALNKLGYKPEDITKILITHKHADHTGEYKSSYLLFAGMMVVSTAILLFVYHGIGKAPGKGRGTVVEK